jgi:hypothetical protein
VQEDALRRLFSPFGAVAEVVLLPSPAGLQTCQALVTFALGGGGAAPAAGALGALRALVDTVISQMQGVPVPYPIHLARAPAELVEVHLPALSAAGPEATPVVELHSIVVYGAEMDFSIAEEVADLREDVLKECSKSGRVARILIPTPLEGTAQGASVPIYVAFDSASAAAACCKSMRTKRFGGRLLTARFVGEEEWLHVQEALTPAL